MSDREIDGFGGGFALESLALRMKPVKSPLIPRRTPKVPA